MYLAIGLCYYNFPATPKQFNKLYKYEFIHQPLYILYINNTIA